jgi:Ca2+-binding RTX toxin-like protein
MPRYNDQSLRFSQGDDLGSNRNLDGGRKFTTLESIPYSVGIDPGLNAATSAADIAGGMQAARDINAVIMEALGQTGGYNDGLVTPDDLMKASDAIRANATLYDRFLVGHGDDENGVATGFHLVQGNGGTLQFQGRAFIDTVADAIYHVGFPYENGRFTNEDGDANEEVADVAGWLNYFLNGKNFVFGSAGDDALGTGEYSAVFKSAENEIFDAGAGNDTVDAGVGKDRIMAGEGADILAGGAGRDYINVADMDNAKDTIVIKPADFNSFGERGPGDVIVGFQSGEDVVDLTAFGAMMFADDEFLGNSQASVIFKNQNLQIDSNGDGSMDIFIRMTGTSAISDSDLLLA